MEGWEKYLQKVIKIPIKLSAKFNSIETQQSLSICNIQPTNHRWEAALIQQTHIPKRDSRFQANHLKRKLFPNTPPHKLIIEINHFSSSSDTPTNPPASTHWKCKSSWFYIKRPGPLPQFLWWRCCWWWFQRWMFRRGRTPCIFMTNEHNLIPKISSAPEFPSSLIQRE